MAHTSAPRPWRCPQDHTCPAPASHDLEPGYNRGCRSGAAKEHHRIVRKRRRENRWVSRRVPSIGTARRLQALATMGWTMVELAERLGTCPAYLRKTARADRDRVWRDTATAVADLYDQLWDQHGRSTITASRARAKGWVPPLAWDDDTIDDPNAEPQVKPKPPAKTTPLEHGRAVRMQRQSEDAAETRARVGELTSAGLSATQVAERLNITVRSVERHRARLNQQQEAA